MTESTTANSGITVTETGGVTAVPGLLSGKVAVVTGGGQGLGLAMARSLVDSGAKVVLADMNEESLQAAVTELGGDGVATGAVCNVSDLGAVENSPQRPRPLSAVSTSGSTTPASPAMRRSGR